MSVGGVGAGASLAWSHLLPYGPPTKPSGDGAAANSTASSNPSFSIGFHNPKWVNGVSGEASDSRPTGLTCSRSGAASPTRFAESWAGGDSEELARGLPRRSRSRSPRTSTLQQHVLTARCTPFCRAFGPGIASTLALVVDKSCCARFASRSLSEGGGHVVAGVLPATPPLAFDLELETGDTRRTGTRRRRAGVHDRAEISRAEVVSRAAGCGCARSTISPCRAGRSWHVGPATRRRARPCGHRTRSSRRVPVRNA